MWSSSPAADPHMNTLPAPSSVSSPSHPPSLRLESAPFLGRLVVLLRGGWVSLWPGARAPPAIVIYRILTRRPLQLDRDLRLRLPDVVVFPERLKTCRYHLHPQHAIRNAVKICL